jgi:hypothetical protein
MGTTHCRRWGDAKRLRLLGSVADVVCGVCGLVWNHQAGAERRLICTVIGVD